MVKHVKKGKKEKRKQESLNRIVNNYIQITNTAQKNLKYMFTRSRVT